MAQKVREVMTSSPTVLNRDTTLREVAQVMRDQGIGDVLVSHEDGSLCGVATDRDLVVRALAGADDAGAMRLADICSSDVVTVSADDDADAAVQLMRERAVRRIPVLDGDRPVGIVTIGDMAIERDERSALSDISAAPPNV